MPINKKFKYKGRMEQNNSENSLSGTAQEKGIGKTSLKEKILSHKAYDYWCSCGKAYKSYPALFLHFSMKHELHLSLKAQKSQREVLLVENTSKFIYDVEKNRKINEQAISKRAREKGKFHVQMSEAQQEAHKKIQASIRKFIKLRVLENEEIVLSLLDYSKTMVLENPDTFNLSQLPFCFNSFVWNEIPARFPRLKEMSIRWKSACATLYEFYQFLVAQNETVARIQISLD